MDRKTILSEPTALWIDANQTKANNPHIAISTRMRLARNLEKIPFPNALDDVNADLVASEISKAIGTKINALPKVEAEFFFFKLAKITPVQRQILFEKHFISKNLLEKPQGREVIVNQEQSISIMINEEDHLRMQCILPELQLTQAWQKVSWLDDLLGKALSFAYSEQLGFLTACPSNIGTGLRASVMLHLPGLVMVNKFKEVVKQLGKLGLTIRGVYGEGSKSYGNLYQISNQVSLGLLETEMINSLQIFVEKVIEMEEQARQTLWQAGHKKMLDIIWRSYGILTNARLISGKEAMEHLSVLRLGAYYAVFNNLSSAKLNRLMVNCQSPFLQEKNESKLSAEGLDWERAKMIRQYFA